MQETFSGAVSSVKKMSLDQIHARIDEITAIADARKAESTDWFYSVHGGSGMAYLNADELAELHQLRLQLPTFYQLRQEAQVRISQKIASRIKDKLLQSKNCFATIEILKL